MKTQAIKLAKILKNGTLTAMTYEALMKNVDAIFNADGTLKKGCDSIHTREFEIRSINENIAKGLSCWKYTPKNKETYYTMSQWSINPYTLINIVFEDLQ